MEIGIAPESEEFPKTATEGLLSARNLGVPKILALVASGAAILISLFHMFTGWFTTLQPQVQAVVSFTMLGVGGLLFYPLGRKSWKDNLNWFFIVDIICILFLVGGAVHLINDFEEILAERCTAANTADLVFGTSTLLIILELTRRVLGWPLVIICSLLLLQNLFSAYLPGLLYGPPIPWDIIIELNYLQDQGIFGLPMRVMSSYLVLFFVLVAMLKATGGGAFFINLALSLSGRFAGGPAKVAVIASGLMGTMQGNAVSNVAATGSFTIPMMKDVGFKPHFAGAVESVASMGGQLVPPIMGMSAFLIADFLGINYFKICLSTLIPVFLFYLGVFMAVHFEAKRAHLSGQPPENLPQFRRVMRDGWPIIIPIVSLLFSLGRGYSMAISAMWAIIILFVVTMLKKSTRLTSIDLLSSLEEGGRISITVGIACAACGIILGTFYVSGLGDRLSMFIITGSGGHLWAGLIITMLVCFVLGMAMPTPVAYITLFVVAIPSIIKLGAHPLSAHFFCFFFAVISNITPPLAICAYIAAGIADAGMMSTAFTAVRLAFPLYMIPYLFVYAPILLLQGPLDSIFLPLISGLIGVTAIGAGLAGWLVHRLNLVEQIILTVCGIALMIPTALTDIVGFTGLFWVFVKNVKMDRQSDYCNVT